MCTTHDVYMRLSSVGRPDCSSFVRWFPPALAPGGPSITVEPDDRKRPMSYARHTPRSHQ